MPNWAGLRWRCDRLGVVTKDGEIIFPDRQLMLFAADVLTRNRARRSSMT